MNSIIEFMKRKAGRRARTRMVQTQKSSIRVKVIVGASLVSVAVGILFTSLGMLKPETSKANSLSYTLDVSSTSTKSVTGASSITWNHTNILGVNQLFVLSITTKDKSVTSATYNSVALTLAGSGTKNAMWTYIYYMKNPPVGTYQVKATTSAGTDIVAGADVINSVDLTGTFVVSTKTGKSANATSGNLTNSLSGFLFSVAGAIQSTASPKNQLTQIHAAGTTTTNTAAYQQGGNNVNSQFNLSSSDDWVVITLFSNTSVPLPVTWKSFDVKRKDGVVSANWITASETNNDYFVLQRSNDGETFTDVSRIKGSGNTTYDTEYTSEDKTDPFSNVYYRVKQVDYDGKFDYTEVKYIKGKNMADDISVYPTIVTDHVNVKLKDSNEHENYTCKIIDMSGKLISEQVITGSDLSEAIELNTSEFAKGTYVVTLENNGKLAGQSRFIKN